MMPPCAPRSPAAGNYRAGGPCRPRSPCGNHVPCQSDGHGPESTSTSGKTIWPRPATHGQRLTASPPRGLALHMAANANRSKRPIAAPRALAEKNRQPIMPLTSSSAKWIFRTVAGLPSAKFSTVVLDPPALPSPQERSHPRLQGNQSKGAAAARARRVAPAPAPPRRSRAAELVAEASWTFAGPCVLAAPKPRITPFAHRSETHYLKCLILQVMLSPDFCRGVPEFRPFPG
jgi:hypothetical protein